MFDMFVTRHLRTQWEAFTETRAEFAKLFQAITAAGNWPSIVDEWYDALSRQDFVKFRTAYNLGLEQHPQIAVTLDEEPIEMQPLGFDFGRTQTEQKFGMYLRQTATIRVFAQHAEHVRALHEFCRQAMMMGVIAFGRAGFSGLEFQSGSDLDPAAEEMPELLGISIRTQRWVTHYEPQVSLSHGAAKGIFVHADDISIAGVDGGVAASVDLVSGASPGSSSGGSPVVPITP